MIRFNTSIAAVVSLSALAGTLIASPNVMQHQASGSNKSNKHVSKQQPNIPVFRPVSVPFHTYRGVGVLAHQSIDVTKPRADVVTTAGFAHVFDKKGRHLADSQNRFSMVFNSRYGEIRKKDHHYYLRLIDLDRVAHLYSQKKRDFLGDIHTNKILSLASTVNNHWVFQSNQTDVFLKPLGRVGSYHQQFTLRSPKKENKRSWQFEIVGYSLDNPPQTGFYELAHLYMNQCQVKKTLHSESRVVC